MLVLALTKDDLSTVYVVLGILTASTVVLTALTKGLLSVIGVIKRANRTIDDLQEIIREWRGEAPDGADPGRPSFPERMANVERALVRIDGILNKPVPPSHGPRRQAPGRG